ncbi:MAG: HupE/UreJ family protein [Paracoccus sp. (in: a-proteobacteria)]|uniref:HupE/UreJ family protein n=1 Tax=Paracoccus sp. TaxID=267 RepID=UPI0026DFD2F6|nr:HupE/UreJ family protein [Paracoccus sp. (in: a-proteobacteria)]MDO5632634.1 HupE/UreJ family protein [Paracoccus sp. (in: a-proteobacteria)]
MKRLFSSAALLLLPQAALAHPGHDTGTLAAGMAHPIGGLDHVLAMVALGVLVAQIGGRAVWLLPTVFVGAMVAGGVAGALGLPFVGVEPMILTSVIVLGALVALALRLPMAVLLAGVAVFGAAHGWAHGAEGPATGLAAYAAGFALATALLHGAGIAVARVAPGLALRAAGAVTGLAGVALAVAG